MKLTVKLTMKLSKQLFMPGLAVALMAMLGSTGCTIEAGAVVDTQTRQFSESFVLPEGEPLRLSNLVGSVELVPGAGPGVEVSAMVHAAGATAQETEQLLAEMRWVESRNKKGDKEWTLTYPVEKHRRFHYNGSGWGNRTQTRYRGQKVSLTTHKTGSTPTLFVDLIIQIPVESNLVVRNAVGKVTGGRLEGQLVVDTGSGDVTLDSFVGNLTVDTGSGDVRIGSVRGETLIDTGSGDVRVESLVGNGRIDTGSGTVAVREVAAGKLEADTGSGDVVIQNGTVSDLVADTGSGSISILGVDVARLKADTGSGDVVVESPWTLAERFVIDTGSGDVKILGPASAAFDIVHDAGSGRLVVRYEDAELRKSDNQIVGARRGEKPAVIRVDTGSGDCIIGPA